jgi:hypothetical protein
MRSFFKKILIRILGTVRIDVQRDFLDQLFATAWTVTRHISLLLVIVLLYLFVLFNNPQGIDIVDEVLINRKYWFWTIVALILFGVSLWFCAFFILQLKQISHDSEFLKWNADGLRFWILIIPKVLGIVPFLSLLFKTSLYSGPSVWFLLILFATIFVLFLVLDELVSIVERQLVNVRWFDDISTEKKTLDSLLYFSGIRVLFYCFLGYTLLLFILSLTSVETGFAVTVGPFAIMVFGLSFLAIVFSMVSYFNLPGRRPFILYFFLLVVFCGIFNDNTQIRTLPKKVKRTTLEADFTSWSAGLMSGRGISITTADVVPGKKPASTQDSTKSIPVIFIATEGGGIRALTWTALILEGLERKFPGIHQNIYAISGVSGGGVGAIFYTSSLHDKLRKKTDLLANAEGFRKAVRSDFLSDLLAAFLFQDNLQNIIPVGIENFNRTRRLEDAWSKSFALNTNSGTMEEGFLKLYEDSTIRLPRLFINGVLAESGQKTIVSFPILKNDPATKSERPDVLADELDVIASINMDIPVKTVASLCSRFPYLTSGGRLRAEGGEIIGRVVDGGYKENTGLETIWQLLLRLRPTFRKIQQQHSGGSTSAKAPNVVTGISKASPRISKTVPKTKILIKPIVIFIKNSPPPEMLDKNRKNNPVLRQTRLPLTASGNSSDRRTPTIDALTENVFKYFSEKGQDSLSCEYIRVDLDRTTKVGYKLPLGWYFSEKSFAYVDSVVATRFNDSDKTFKKIDEYIKK